MNQLKYTILIFVIGILPHIESKGQNGHITDAEHIYKVADSLYTEGYNKHALDTLLYILPDFNEINNKNLESKILGLFGHLHKNTGNDTVSIRKFIAALDKSQLKQYLAAVKAMGFYFRQRAHHTKALGYFKKMILFANTIQDDTSLTQAYFYTGTVFKAMLNYSKAQSYFFKVLNRIKKTGHQELLVKTYNELGDLFMETNRQDSATEYFQKAISLAKTIQSKESQLIAYHRMANIMHQKGDVAEASKYLDKGIMLARKSYPGYLPKLLLEKADMERQSNTIPKTIETYQTTLKAARKQHNLQVQIQALRKLAQLFTKTNKLKMANQHYKLAIQKTDSLQKINSIEVMANFEARYNLMQKEQEIKLLDRERKLKEAKLNNQKLRSKIYLWGIIILLLLAAILISHIYSRIRKNKLLASQNAKINEQNEELNQINQQLSESENKLMQALSTKNKLFAIIGHDMKSPLMDIKNLIFILKNNPAQFAPDELQKHATQIDNRLTSLLELLNNLLNWGMAERNTLKYTPEQIHINKLIENTTKLFEGQIGSKALHLKKHMPEALYCKTDRNMLEFVIRNLLSNAIKFSESNQFITLDVYSKEGNIHIRIADQGIGMTASQIRNITGQSAENVRRGTHNEKGTGLGIAVANDFVKQMNGQMTINSEEGKGTIVEVTFPHRNI